MSNDIGQLYTETIHDETNLVTKVKRAIMLAMNGNSKLPAPLLAMYGMSGRNMRHFLNNLCSNEETNYLEIGVHTGSTFCSALYGNRVRAVAIDNFSEFNTVNVGDENYPTDKAFHDNLNMVIGENRVNFYNVDCFSLDVGLLLGENGDSRFNVYFQDGNHTKESQRDALEKYSEVMEDEFVFIIDDWNWLEVRDGTYDAIKHCNLDILQKWEVHTVDKETNSPPVFEKLGGSSLWHNGVVVFVLRK